MAQSLLLTSSLASILQAEKLGSPSSVHLPCPLPRHPLQWAEDGPLLAWAQEN